MPSAGYEAVTPASKRLQAYVLDRPASWIGPTPDTQLVHHKLWRTICGYLSKVDFTLLMNSSIVPTPNNKKNIFSWRSVHNTMKSMCTACWNGNQPVQVM